MSLQKEEAEQKVSALEDVIKAKEEGDEAERRKAQHKRQAEKAKANLHSVSGSSSNSNSNSIGAVHQQISSCYSPLHSLRFFHPTHLLCVYTGIVARGLRG